jgi:hypothetical protein
MDIVDKYTAHANISLIAQAFSDSIRSRLAYVINDPMYVCATIMDPMNAFTWSTDEEIELYKAKFKIQFSHFVNSEHPALHQSKKKLVLKLVFQHHHLRGIKDHINVLKQLQC